MSWGTGAGPGVGIAAGITGSGLGFWPAAAAMARIPNPMQISGAIPRVRTSATSRLSSVTKCHKCSEYCQRKLISAVS